LDVRKDLSFDSKLRHHAVLHRDKLRVNVSFCCLDYLHFLLLYALVVLYIRQYKKIPGKPPSSVFGFFLENKTHKNLVWDKWGVER
jgi:hypothetical protein